MVILVADFNRWEVYFQTLLVNGPLDSEAINEPLSIGNSIYLSIWLSAQSSICLSIYPSFFISMYVYIYIY